MSCSLPPTLPFQTPRTGAASAPSGKSEAMALLPGRRWRLPSLVTRKLRSAAASPIFSLVSPSGFSFSPPQALILNTRSFALPVICAINSPYSLPLEGKVARQRRMRCCLPLPGEVAQSAVGVVSPADTPFGNRAGYSPPCKIKCRRCRRWCCRC